VRTLYIESPHKPHLVWPLAKLRTESSAPIPKSKIIHVFCIENRLALKLSSAVLSLTCSGRLLNMAHYVYAMYWSVDTV
jgi:hypothetical protein